MYTSVTEEIAGEYGLEGFLDESGSSMVLVKVTDVLKELGYEGTRQVVLERAKTLLDEARERNPGSGVDTA